MTTGLYKDYEGSEPHAPSRVVADGRARNLIYEDNGNLTIGYDFNQTGPPPERRLTYNAENMPLTIEYQPQGGSTVATQLTYDGEGRRVKKETGGDSVIYVDETYEIRNGQPVKYVFAGDLRVARIRGSEVHYFHRDHLNSSSLVTNATGALIESTTYEPYGLQRADCQPKINNVPYTFTDQEWDSETGLYNYDARLYVPMLGRFLTADSVVPNWYDPQALNRYSYARNNPLAYVDPDGHSFLDAIPGTISAGVGYVGIGIAYVGSRPAIGMIWLFDRAGAAQANAGVNEAFSRITRIQTEYVALPSVAGDAVGAGIAKVLSKIASRQSVSVAKVTEEAVEASYGTANNNATRAKLLKQLTSESQVAEVNAGNAERMAGAGTATEFRDAPRIVSEYGGEVGDWAKVKSSTVKQSGAYGTKIETHAVQNVKTGQVIEHKTKVFDD